MTDLGPTTDGRMPLPYDEEKDSNIFWENDFGDDMLPSKGFITDFVYHLRGTEVPTAFGIWSAISALASVIKREAWFAYGSERLYPNFYVLLVGPPGIVKKSTAINKVSRLLQNFHLAIFEKNVREVKRIKLILNKATPEAILGAIKPHNSKHIFKDKSGRVMKGKDGKAITYEPTSEFTMLLSEMAVMIGKQSYSESMIENLLDMYDPHEVWQWLTVKRGAVIMRNLCTNLLAGTTVTGFKESIPMAAAGDGFLSRSTVVYAPDTARSHTFPRVPDGAPQIDQLQARLAWIATKSWGPYELSPEAYNWYDEWYHEHHEMLRRDSAFSGLRSRVPQQVLKTAMIISASRYDYEKTITLADVQQAHKLVLYTVDRLPDLVVRITDKSGTMENKEKVLQYLRKNGMIKRRLLMQRSHMKVAQLDAALYQLKEEGRLIIIRDGKMQGRITSAGHECYKLREDPIAHVDAKSIIEKS